MSGSAIATAEDLAEAAQVTAAQDALKAKLPILLAERLAVITATMDRAEAVALAKQIAGDLVAEQVGHLHGLDDGAREEVRALVSHVVELVIGVLLARLGV